MKLFTNDLCKLDKLFFNGSSNLISRRMIMGSTIKIQTYKLEEIFLKETVRDKITLKTQSIRINNLFIIVLPKNIKKSIKMIF